MDSTLRLPGGRTLGYATFGAPDGTPVVWCHGGPGSRLEPAGAESFAAENSILFVGIDRPGYGNSTPAPGRTIASWAPDALAVLDVLGAAKFAAAGVSTGGAYALALAALAPERVLGVVACCALTDMRWTEGRALMPGAGTRDLWDAPDRETAWKHAEDLFGPDGSRMFSGEAGGELAPADLALLGDPEWLALAGVGMRASFAQGVAGYTDDRLADGPGWGSFDLAQIRCPVTVIHGEQDTIVPVPHAHHTARIAPGATLRLRPDHGHLSIIGELPQAVVDLLKG